MTELQDAVTLADELERAPVNNIYRDLSITIDEQGLRMDIEAVMQACPVLDYPAATATEIVQVGNAKANLVRACTQLLCAAEIAGPEVRARFGR